MKYKVNVQDDSLVLCCRAENAAGPGAYFEENVGHERHYKTSGADVEN